MMVERPLDHHLRYDASIKSYEKLDVKSDRCMSSRKLSKISTICNHRDNHQ